VKRVSKELREAAGNEVPMDNMELMACQDRVELAVTAERKVCLVIQDFQECQEAEVIRVLVGIEAVRAVLDLKVRRDPRVLSGAEGH